MTRIFGPDSRMNVKLETLPLFFCATNVPFDSKCLRIVNQWPSRVDDIDPCFCVGGDPVLIIV